MLRLKLKLKPLGLGLLVFITLYLGWNAFVAAVSPFALFSKTYWVVMTVGCFPWLAAGFVAATVARQNGTLHGVILAPVTSIIEELDCIHKLPDWVHNACTVGDAGRYLIVGAVLGALGGLVWDIKEAMTRRLTMGKT